LRIFIVFRDTIYASGLQASLAAAPGIDAVGYATSIALAWEDEALLDADVVVVDGDLGGAGAFIQEVAVGSGAGILLCLREATTPAVLEAIASGAGGAVARDLLTPDTLLAAVSAVAAGICAFDVGVLRTLTGAAASAALPSQRSSRAASGTFTDREQHVLSLVAAGLSTREIARQLSYSERTIKTVVHDVVTKLGVKSRSEAVALAVRERMI
jgi:DNA-binding NarL/FixJ family response regulator